MQGIEPPYTDPYVRWCERSTSQLMASLLLDYGEILDVTSYRCKNLSKYQAVKSG